MNCVVRILSRVDERQSVHTFSGVITPTSFGSEISYRQENSFVTLELRKDTVSMLREGDCYIRLTFRPHTHTQGEIGVSAESKGTVDVFTCDLSVFEDMGKEGKRICKVQLEYVLAFSVEEQQRVFLRIVAESK